MILPTHHLGRHVSRCTTCICIIVGLDDPCDPEICHTNVALFVKDQVLGLDVSVDDVVEMEKLKSVYDRGDKELRLGLFESSPAAHVVS